jgi:hypothetical protein
MKPGKCGLLAVSGLECSNFIIEDLLLYPARCADTLNYLKFLKRKLERYLTFWPNKACIYWFKK